jgi:FKBP-type peptidyl-prolyl cis-trans isomerase FklB
MTRFPLVVAAVMMCSLTFASSSIAQNDAKSAATTTDKSATPAASAEAQAKDYKAITEKASYIMGMSFAKNIERSNQNGADLDPEIVFQAMKEALAGKAKYTDADIQAMIGEIGQALQARAAKAAAKATLQNKAYAVAFIPLDKDKKGITRMANGIQYQVLKEGKGASPAVTDKVRVHYKGYLTNGTVFDSSYKRGQPSEFGLNQVIKGWTLALSKMNPGAKWRVYIPSELAYGKNGAGAQIGPNSPLIFEVELIKVLEPKPAPAPGRIPAP